jgi:hypothetical protein
VPPMGRLSAHAPAASATRQRQFTGRPWPGPWKQARRTSCHCAQRNGQAVTGSGRKRTSSF